MVVKMRSAMPGPAAGADETVGDPMNPVVYRQETNTTGGNDPKN
jgi:hypothetical protein